ncbi:MAG: branched-chain amino acid ABC transporter permease [Thaumarchaeota archaeon]|nr:branched-chain amino acid ABC transporter permease [Candidatus Calditenuaceae archaeon]MDW8043167.1 branched-chain amino acid ABC transporter permease [Nitrososphaerota archaeon]
MSAPSGIYSKSYEDEIAIARTPIERLALIIGSILLLVFPLITPTYYSVVAIYIFIAIISSIGLNILTGFAGQVSLGHSALMAVGAYAAAVAARYAGLQFLPAIFIGGLAAACAGFVFGAPSLRIKGFYLAISTLLAHYIIFFIIHLPSVAPLLGVPHGFILPDVALGPFTISGTFRNLYFYYIALGLAVFSIITAHNLMRSRIGRAFVAIRDNENAAEVLGINVYRYKLLAFTISSFYAGLAGATYVYFVRVIIPGHFELRVTIEYIAIILLGGLGRIWGSILGSFIIIILSEGIRYITVTYLYVISPEVSAYVEAFKLVIYGAIIIVIILTEPYGVVALLRKVKQYFKLWPFRY